MRQRSRAFEDAYDRSVRQPAKLRAVRDANRPAMHGRNSLRRSGFLLREEAKGSGALVRRSGRGAAAAAGVDVGGYWNFALYVLSTVVLLALMKAMLEGRGPAAVQTAFGWVGGGVQRFFSPTDPLIPQGAVDAAAAAGGAAVGTAVAASTAAARHTGRLVPVPGNLATRNGIQLDAGVAPEATAVARRFGVRINSGYRSAADNRAAGGAPNSDHLRGTAADFTGSRTAMQALQAWAERQGFPYVEPTSQTGGTHVHISFAR